MSDGIYHHTRCNLDDGSGDLHGKASVALFDGGTVIVSMFANSGSASMQMHIDADSLRAFAKLLNEAVNALPTPISLVGSAAIAKATGESGI